MKRMIKIVLATCVVAASPAHAAIQTLNGAGFDAVYDDTLLGLFGTPTLSGDGRTIIFTPTQFIAQSVGTQGTVLRNDSVTFDIRPLAGKRVAGIRVLEAGDYKLVDRNPVGLNPAVDVSGEVRLTNLQDGISFLSSQLTENAPLNLVCADSSCPTTPWTATASITTPLDWPAPVNGAPNVRFFLEDLLTAESFLLGDSAFVQKKQASNTISVDVHVVPVPAALPLLASALAGLGALGRRRRMQA